MMGTAWVERTGLRVMVVALLAYSVPVLGVAPAGANDTSDTASVAPGPDLTAVRARIKDMDWAGALTLLTVIAARVQHADIDNLLGFVHRNRGEHQTALRYYTQALALNPNHKGAHEYLGELFVKVGDMASAHAHAVTLLRLCPNGCEELDDLRAAIAKGPGTATMTDAISPTQ